MNTKKWASRFGFLALGLIVFNFLANQTNWQWDLTADKRYTISPETKAVLTNMDQPVEVYVFLKGDNLPSAFKRLQKATRDLLQQFEQQSHGYVHFQFENPIKDASPQEQEDILVNLQNRGISPTNVRIKSKDGYVEQLIFPGALINGDNTQFPVKLLSGQRGQQDINRSIELLEYQFINAITKLQQSRVATVGFSRGHGELNALETQSLQENLFQNFYKTTSVDVTESSEIADSVDLLVMAKPQEFFTEAEKFSIDQYLMNGGKLLLAIDPMKMDLDSLQSVWGGRNVAVDEQLNLDDLLFQYGVRLNRNLVRDLQSKPIPVVVDENGQTQLIPWTFFPVVSGEEESEITNKIQPVSFEFVSGIDTLRNPSLKTKILLRSSENSGLVANPVLVDLEELRNPPPISSFSLQHIPLAVLVSGNFHSLYEHRGSPVAWTTKIQKESPDTRIAVISDGDVLRNSVQPDGRVLPLGFDRATGEQFGNSEFLINLVDYLINPEHPLGARNKNFAMQLLNQTRAEQERSRWQLLSFVIPISSIILFGIFFVYFRKRKYT